jgi:single-strand DNA-binding protein
MAPTTSSWRSCPTRPNPIADVCVVHSTSPAQVRIHNRCQLTSRNACGIACSRATNQLPKETPMPEPADPLTHRNEVLLVGRVAADPRPVQLPSGDELLTFRLIVHRPPKNRRSRPGPPQDTLACSVWATALQRTVGRWRAGDIVEVSGALRRRFLKSNTMPTSVHDIEVLEARRLHRAPL